MPDPTFDSTLGAQLRGYAEGGVRPVDRYAVSRAAIASGKQRRWAPALDLRLPGKAVVVGLAMLALLGALLALGAGRTFIRPVPLVDRDQIRSAPALAVPRWQPELVTLDDGRVLVVGGNVGLDTTSEVYDPVAGTSTPTGPMVSARALVISSAVRLADGRVLLIGDARPFDAPFFGVAQVFDPSTDRFVAVGPMVAPRAAAESALLPDGRVLITGGTPPTDINTNLASAELFDPATGLFSSTGSMRTSRAGHAMATLQDGRILVVGGATWGGSVGLATAEVYEPTTGTFAPGGSLSIAVERTIALTLSDGRVAVLASTTNTGSGRVEFWDPTVNDVTGSHDLPKTVVSATTLDDGRIFVTGVPSRASTWAGVIDRTAETSVLETSVSAWWPSTVRLKDGRVLIAGGLTDGNIRPENGGQLAPAVATVEIFEPRTTVPALTISPGPTTSIPSASVQPSSNIDGYEGVLLRASADAPDTDVDVVAVRPGGEERLIRHLPASILPDGRRFVTYGEVSQDGWLAVHTDVGSDNASPAFALLDLRDPTRPLQLVPYQPVIGGAWGPNGLFATVVQGPTLAIEIVDAESGKTRTLENLSLPGGGPELIWAADGSGLLVSTGDGGFAIAPLDGSPPVPGRPALLPDPLPRLLAPDGTSLNVCATGSGSGCSDHPGAPVWTTTSGGELTDWYTDELGPARIIDATFAADWRSVWLVLYRMDGAHRIAIVARADAPGQWQVKGETDLGTGTETIFGHGIAADDSVLAIGRDNGTGTILPFELIRTQDGAGSTHSGNLLGLVPPKVADAWPAPGSD